MAAPTALTQKLQAILEQRSHHGHLIEPASPAAMAGMIDFGSNDTLSISSSGTLSQAFLSELNKHPNFQIGSRSTRVFEGTSQYMLEVEDYLADFHKADAALFFNSGFDANTAIWSTVPQPGDLVLYDEYVHASIHDGMRKGRAETRSFLHNDCLSLRRCLVEVKLQHPNIAQGKNLVFIALESFYSMDGDAAPAQQMIASAKEILPFGNVVFVIDEAHSNGIVGPNGSGFVNHYGLEKEFAIRVQTFGKALGSTGAAVLTTQAVKAFLLNYARNIIFTTAPTFLTLAAVKAGYRLLASEEGKIRRQRLQENIRYFYHELTSHPEWPECNDLSILAIHSGDGWRSGPFQSPIVSLITRIGHSKSLGEKLKKSKYWVNVVYYPVVPKDKERARLMLHADNTPEQIQRVVGLIMEWAIERGRFLLKKVDG